MLTNRATKLILLSSFFTLALGCSSDRQPRAFGGISNKGLLPLSTANSNLGANNFLSTEAGKSSALKGFITSRGAPHAIKVQDHKVRPTDMTMYYPRESAFYVAELESSILNYDWIVRGPFKLPPYEEASVRGSNIELSSEPVLTIDNRQVRIKPNPSVTEKPQPKTPTPIVIPNHLVPPKSTATKPKPTPMPIKKISATPTPKPTATPKKIEAAPTPFKQMNYDQMAILMSHGYAERDISNGDVIHTVNDSSEGLEQISNWYTGSKANITALAEASGIAADKKLLIGDRIRVPFKLTKNTKQMK